MLIRYIIATVGAITIISAGFLFAAITRKSFLNDIRQHLRDAIAAGTLPEVFQGVDIETVELNDIGIEVTPGMMWQLRATNFLERLWFAWPPLVLLACFGMAALLRIQS